jgi:hypothetical protein
LVKPQRTKRGLFLDGVNDPDRGQTDAPWLTTTSHCCVNNWWQPLDFSIPEIGGRSWRREIDTFDLTAAQTLATGDRPTVGPRSIVVLSSTVP